MRKAGNEQSRPPVKRRLKTKPVLVVLGILLAGNLLWFTLWATKDGGSAAEGSEQVASVGKTSITREDWMAAMESQYGRETLRELVNRSVMEAAAKKYGIRVSDGEIDLELALLRSEGEGTSDAFGETDGSLREQVKSRLILEKVLTKDVIVEDGDIKRYYKENEALYDVKSAYRASVIVLPDQEEAEKALKELDNGSSFGVLARERSIDAASASLGGDIGYVGESSENIDPAIVKAAEGMKEGDIAGPVTLADGTVAVIQVSGVYKGRSFKFDEVKDQIRRELALEQLTQSVTPEAFWNEFDAQWFYGDE
ncbi:peptidyl-prolyl cis-trans isomerase [Bhargavaea cecembensis]|uniref:peptidyl-prolyl cis-trans isomerase n=1 Tax=Bhargavaea cecembensis TaxID=394098 RepID=UPI0005911037|nr:peptidyl-prolyl cis-trans isomerase [Bhargavaea cecembensis]